MTHLQINIPNRRGALFVEATTDTPGARVTSSTAGKEYNTITFIVEVPEPDALFWLGARYNEYLRNFLNREK